MSKCFRKYFLKNLPIFHLSSESCVHAEWSIGTHIKDGYGVVERSLSRETDLAVVRIHWPPHTPDINHLYFYLWGYMKDEIVRKKFILQLLKWRSKSKISSYQYLLKFYGASLENWTVAFKLYFSQKKNV